jgi:hypothetical protein
MFGDKAHGLLLASGWRWQDATSYHRDTPRLSLALEPQANVSADAPTEERLHKLRSGRWVLRSGKVTIAVFDSLPPAATAIVPAVVYSP